MKSKKDLKAEIKRLKSKNIKLQMKYDDLAADTERVELALAEIFVETQKEQLFSFDKLNNIERILAPFYGFEGDDAYERNMIDLLLNITMI